MEIKEIIILYFYPKKLQVSAGFISKLVIKFISLFHVTIGLHNIKSTQSDQNRFLNSLYIFITEQARAFKILFDFSQILECRAATTETDS